MEEYNSRFNGGTDIIDGAEKAMSVFAKLNHFMEKHGLKNTILTFLVLFICFFLLYCFFNPGPIIDKIGKIQAENAAKQMEERIKVDPTIRANLITLRETLDADRAFIFEMHNGNTNISGLHFIYVDMTYDEPNSGHEKILQEYLNMRTSNYPWIGDIYEKHYWFGKIEKLKDVDPEIYFRLKKEGVTDIGLIMIDDGNIPNGILGISYYSDDNIPQDDDIRRMMNKYAIIMAPQISSKKK